jgi:hypothetical protein
MRQWTLCHRGTDEQVRRGRRAVLSRRPGQVSESTGNLRKHVIPNPRRR